MKTTSKKFPWLEVGDVIIDPQGKRCTVTAIGDWETFDDVWDDKKGDVVSERGRKIFYRYHSEVLGHDMDAESSIVESAMADAVFRVEVR